jgi:hypothetical protein
MAPAREQNNTQYQYSARLARPVNVAYREMHVLTASPNPIAIVSPVVA